MHTHVDVAVLGGGVAGVAAALAAAERGARTCIITAAPGATAMFAGGWRGGCPDGLRRALAGVDYELRECATPLAHSNGHLSACALAPPAHQAARLTNDTIVVDIVGLAGFDAAGLARQWSRRAGVRLPVASATIDGTPAAGWATVALATRIERTPAVFVSALRLALQNHHASHVIVPAVIGSAFTDDLRASVAAELAVIVAEALAVPPSLPGWRLHNALHRALAAAGVGVLGGRAIARERRNGQIESIELPSGDVVHAHSFVLATGKFAAGGIEAERSLREPALNCPVWIEHLGERFDRADSLMLSDPVRTEQQPLLAAGVHADAEHRPLNAAGDVVYSNVRIAGSVRADWSVTTHGIGDAAMDGWTAGAGAVGR